MIHNLRAGFFTFPEMQVILLRSQENFVLGFIINTKKFKIHFELIHQPKSLSEKIGDVPGTAGTSPIFSTEPEPTIECSKIFVDIQIDLNRPNTALDIRFVAFFAEI